jgi:flavin reductase (DIM6/NTAB) family NADH-FMN oxidoreductase RutF
LTVSSVLLAQGEPPMLAGLVAPSSDLADTLAGGSGRFVVHLLGAAHRRLAQHFAGDLRAPAELLTRSTSERGPVLGAAGDRIFCRAESLRPFGWSLLVEAVVEDVQVAAAGKGLAWFRGGFYVPES